MIVFFAFGALLAAISLWMAWSPSKFANGIVSFSRWRWFHAFEVISRLLIGIAFVWLAENYIYQALAEGFGYLLILVAVGLLLTGEARHRRFAERSADIGRRIFRPAGVVGCALGGLLAYSATLTA